MACMLILLWEEKLLRVSLICTSVERRAWQLDIVQSGKATRQLGDFHLRAWHDVADLALVLLFKSLDFPCYGFFSCFSSHTDVSCICDRLYFCATRLIVVDVLSFRLHSRDNEVPRHDLFGPHMGRCSPSSMLDQLAD